MKMAIEFYEFDRDGDLMLILNSPSEGYDDTECSESPDTNTTEDVDLELAVDGTTNDEQLSPVQSSNTSEQSKEMPEDAVHMLVSSKSLILASPVFKAMLRKDTFQEGTQLHSTGQLLLPLPDDNPAAMRILLNVLHFRSAQVPRKVSFSMLTHLSILIDKYQMLEAVQTFADCWIIDDEITNSLPTSFASSNLLPWLTISWVFNLPDKFKQLTKISIQESNYKIREGIHDGHDLPIPDIVIGMKPQRHTP